MNLFFILIEIICPLPPALPHTSYQLTGNKLDSKATYFCNIGYQPLNGTGVSYCLEREEWSLATLECEGMFKLFFWKCWNMLTLHLGREYSSLRNIDVIKAWGLSTLFG